MLWLCVWQDPGSGEAFKDDAICQEFLANEHAMAQIDNTKTAAQVSARSA